MVIDNNAISLPHSQFLIYQAPDGQVTVDVKFDGDMAWLI